jgi:nucleoside-diphosphate-sugar epimerase
VYVEICHTENAVIQDSLVYTFWISLNNEVKDPEDQVVNDKVVVRANNGDVTYDCFVDIDDAVREICYVFEACPPPDPLQLGNVDCSEDIPIDIDDIVYLINYIFGGGAPPKFCPELWDR